MKDVYIVDYFLQDCIGTDAEQNYKNLLSGPGAQSALRYDISKYPHIQSTKGFHMHYAEPGFNPFKLAVNMTNQMGERYGNILPADTATVFGSFAIGSEVRDEFTEAFDTGQRRYSPTKLFSNNHDLISAIVAGKLRLEGINTSANAACSSSMFNLYFASLMIQAGQVNAAIVGAVDMPIVAKLQYYWQCTSAISTIGGGSSIPFDNKRDGFLQGEGGTMWLVCDEETLVKHNLKPKAKLRSIASGAKVASMTAHDKTCENQIKIINQALSMANLKAEDMAFFNAHATSTPVGDDIEVDVFQKVFEGIDIPIMSFKGYIGHTMSACGLIESAYGLEAVKAGYLHPNANLTDPLSDDPRIITKQTPLNGKIFMKASFGFGGRTSIAIFESLE
jgi:3-oxoacyl-[acyl-carrier-protein] synthase II